jgi:3-deoxy-D-manno-octulosonic-acid transferase
MGNIKFDLAVPAELLERGWALRAQLGAQRPVWIAASTHEGEDEIALAAHRRVLETWPDAVLILVPRHPQRFDAVARLIEKSGLRVSRRSGTPPGAQTQVLLGDSMGEMFVYFAASDVAFVAGSLAPVGGHNVLEPAALGLPVLFGPQMFNFVHARELLLGVNAATEITDTDSLAAAVLALLSAPDQRARMGTAGRAAVDANRGALTRLLELV